MVKNSAGISANSADASATTYRVFPILDISLNDVSFTSMTVHGAVYAADKNVTGFDVSWNPADGAWIVPDASNVYITGLDEQNIPSMAGQRIRGESAQLGEPVQPPYRIFPILPIFRSTTCPLLP
jgi:hypothetical protein